MPREKSFYPLESDPELFTELIHELGVSRDLAFHDVLSLDELDVLAMVPRPVMALILVFPAAEDYVDAIMEKTKEVPLYDKSGDDEVVMWYKQTIYNACGLYAILHAVSNHPASEHVVPGSHLAHLLAACRPVKTAERASILENDPQLEKTHTTFATKGQTAVPDRPDALTDHHFIAFSSKDGHLYQMDGDRPGPLDRGALDEADDLLSDKVLAVIREIVKEAAGDVTFGLMALAASQP